MAFSINAHNLPSCSDYESAVRAFEKAPGWGRRSGRYDGEKRLTSRPDRDHMGVRMNEARDVIFRYHSTDVLTWHANGSFTINPYNSVSTSAFIGSFAPSYSHAHMTNSAGAVMCFYKRGPNYERYGHRIYVLTDRTTFKQVQDTWSVDPEGENGTETIDYPRMRSRTAARAVLTKHGFYELVSWLPAAMEILKLKTVNYNEAQTKLEEVAFRLNDTRYGHQHMVDVLDDRSLWPAFLMSRNLKPDHQPYRSYWGRHMGYTTKRHVDRIVRAVRAAVYAVEGLIETEELPYATSWGQMAAARAARRTYGYGRY